MYSLDLLHDSLCLGPLLLRWNRPFQYHIASAGKLDLDAIHAVHLVEHPLDLRFVERSLDSADRSVQLLTNLFRSLLDLAPYRIERSARLLLIASTASCKDCDNQ